MKYDAILLTDLEDALVPVKTTGAFKIASVLRPVSYTHLTLPTKRIV